MGLEKQREYIWFGKNKSGQMMALAYTILEPFRNSEQQGGFFTKPSDA
jgi:hypothetical protein